MQRHDSGPRFLDPHQAARIKDATTQRYRKALAPFLAFLVDNRFSPVTAPEFDDLVVEFMNAEFSRITKSSFEGLVAALEHVLPQLCGNLPWSHAVIDSWSAICTAEHTTPMCSGPAALIGAHMAAEGHARLGAGVVLQCALGLRPSEVLALQGGDVTMPEYASFTNSAFATFGLGVRDNTKAKRAQCVMLQNERLLALTRWLLSETGQEDLLIGYSYAQYRRILGRACDRIGLRDLHFTPHSPRSGFATELFAQGVPFDRIKALSRWVSDQSLRTYLGVVTAALISVSLKTAHLHTAMCYCEANLLDFFVGADKFLLPSPSAPSASNFASHDGLRLEEVVGGDLAVTCRKGDGTCVAATEAEALLDSAGEHRVQPGLELAREDRGRGRVDRRQGRRCSSSLKGDRRVQASRQDGEERRPVSGRGRGRGRQ